MHTQPMWQRALLLTLLAATTLTGACSKKTTPAPNATNDGFQAHTSGQTAAATTNTTSPVAQKTLALTAPLKAVEGATVITIKPDACRAMDACKRDGLCTLKDAVKPDSGCEASYDVDCLASEACTKLGHCRALNGKCVTDAVVRARCKRQYSCKKDGSGCEPIDGKCSNPPGFACRDNARCTTHGECTALLEQSCLDESTCSPARARCGATEDTDCLASDLCKRTGRCKAGDEILPTCTCDATPAQLKENPDLCIRHKRTNLCILTDGGCRASKACDERGACTAKVSCGGARCATTTDADCASSKACKEDGRCAILPMSSFYRCGPTDPKHCKASEGCKNEGRCKLDEARCVK